MIVTDAELETLRSSNQSTRLNLFIYEPTEVMRAVISDPEIEKSEIYIHYDGATPTGTQIDIFPDTTLLVGTTAGGQEMGRMRIRSATQTGASGTFVVSENSNVDWQDGQYLTALKYWEVWPA